MSYKEPKKTNVFDYIFYFLYTDPSIKRKYIRLKRLEGKLGFGTPTKIDFITESVERKLKHLPIKSLERRMNSKIGRMYLKQEFKKFLMLKFDYHLFGLENTKPIELFKYL